MQTFFNLFHHRIRETYFIIDTFLHTCMWSTPILCVYFFCHTYNLIPIYNIKIIFAIPFISMLCFIISIMYFSSSLYSALEVCWCTFNGFVSYAGSSRHLYRCMYVCRLAVYLQNNTALYMTHTINSYKLGCMCVFSFLLFYVKMKVRKDILDNKKSFSRKFGALVFYARTEVAGGVVYFICLYKWSAVCSKSTKLTKL